MGAKYDFTIKRGDTFTRVITIRTNNVIIDLTGYTAKMQIRSNDTAETLFKELTTENGGIVLGGQNGTITITIPSTDTEAFSFINAKYDLELKIGSYVKTELEGIVTLLKDVTRNG